jgi:hypothetical protein
MRVTNAGQGDGRSVDLGRKQTSENDLVERRVGSAGQEAVKLHQELEVDIVALGGSAVSALDVVAVEIDTHGGGCRCEIWRCWVWRWMRRTTEFCDTQARQFHARPICKPMFGIICPINWPQLHPRPIIFTLKPLRP